MADKATEESWLRQLTHLPTASGLESRVAEWVEKWVGRRDDLHVTTDSGGNLFVSQRGRKRKPPVLAVAHMDHPAFVITAPDGSFEFRGGVDDAYFEAAAIEVVSREGGPVGVVTAYEGKSSRGHAEFRGAVFPNDIAMWRFGPSSRTPGLFRAPACDDLAGVAAALAALDRARRQPGLSHFGVMLTRAEEVGLIGAIHAAKHQTIPEDTRLLSIETSRALPNAPIGAGPIIRTGDRSTVFDREMTNRITNAVRSAGIEHQRKLMDGGGCEATAFGAYGYQATGLCLALGNWHNRGNLSQVEAGETTAATPMLEEISLADFHGLIRLLLVAAEAVDAVDDTADSLDRLYESNRHYLR